MVGIEEQLLVGYNLLLEAWNQWNLEPSRNIRNAKYLLYYHAHLEGSEGVIEVTSKQKKQYL